MTRHDASDPAQNATRALRPLETYAAQLGCDTGETLTNIVDLVANLMHLADAISGRIGEGHTVVASAATHYDAERLR